MRELVPRNVLSVIICVFYCLDKLCINSNVFCQVFPLWIKVINQFLLPVSVPLLKLFFSVYAYVKAVIHFIVNQLFGVVLVREALVQV